MTTSAHPSLIARLAEIRREAAALLGDIDTRFRPKPQRMEAGGMPGPVWEPCERWQIRVADPDDLAAAVFVAHSVMWEGELAAYAPAAARRIGMAFLAAADWADRMQPAGPEEVTG